MTKRQDVPTGRPLFDSEFGRMCPDCSRPVDACECAEVAARERNAPPDGDGVVRVSRDTKGRKGKGVTFITGIPLPRDELVAYARTLKRRCGTGGTVKDRVVEIQGDQRDVIVAELEKRGWTVKRTGG